MLVGLFFSSAMKEKLLHAALLHSGGLLATFGIPWLVDISFQFLVDLTKYIKIVLNVNEVNTPIIRQKIFRLVNKKITCYLRKMPFKYKETVQK